MPKTYRGPEVKLVCGATENVCKCGEYIEVILEDRDGEMVMCKRCLVTLTRFALREVGRDSG